MKGRGLACALLVAGAFGPGLAQYAPAPILDILYARPFVLTQGYQSRWESEHPTVTSGYVVVLAVHPVFLRLQAGAMPVLCAGSHTVEWIDHDFDSGILVGIVPERPDLSQTIFWFAAPAYPERMTSERIQTSRAAAVAAAIGPPDAQSVTEALAAGGAELQVADKAALLEATSTLLAAYSGGG